ncbi:MAG: kelch repeat-containing protein [Planctomycetaceae bacterium]
MYRRHPHLCVWRIRLQCGTVLYRQRSRRESTAFGRAAPCPGHASLESGWRELESCPGTARWVHTMAVIDNQLYVIGGATGDTRRDGTNYGYCTVVDNWRFNTKDEQWTRLPDTPIASGNVPRSTSNVFRNRYIILPGGYRTVMCSIPTEAFANHTAK